MWRMHKHQSKIFSFEFSTAVRWYEDGFPSCISTSTTTYSCWHLFLASCGCPHRYHSNQYIHNRLKKQICTTASPSGQICVEASVFTSLWRLMLSCLVFRSSAEVSVQQNFTPVSLFISITLIDGFCGELHFTSQLCTKTIKNNQFGNAFSRFRHIVLFHSITAIMCTGG